MLKGFKWLEGKYVVCAKYYHYHYQGRLDIADKTHLSPSDCVPGSALWLCQTHQKSISIAHHFN